MIAVTADQLALGPVTGRLSRPRRGAGELVVWNDGHLDFAALHQRLHPGVARARRLAVTRPARFVVFNLLARNEGDLRARRTAGVAARWRCCLSPPAGSADADADARLSHQPMAAARPPFPTHGCLPSGRTQAVRIAGIKYALPPVRADTAATCTPQRSTPRQAFLREHGL